MNTNSISFSQRAHFLHTYVNASVKQQPEASTLASSPLSTQLQHGRLTTQEVSQPYFTGRKNLIGQTQRDLKQGKVISQNKMISVALILMSKKAIQLALKKILSRLEQERFSEYLKECRRKLKENFQEFYLKVQQGKE